MTEENESLRKRFDEEDDEVKNLKHRLAIADEDMKHFQVLLHETEQKPEPDL